MNGLGVRDLLALAREPGGRAATPPVLVVGPLADQLRRELAAGGDAGALSGSCAPEDAAALLILVGPSVDAGQHTLLRQAARSLVPLVAVRLDPRCPVPYVPAENIVDCGAGAGFPTPAVAAALVRALGDAAAATAARLPVLREAGQRQAALRATARAGTLAAFTREPHLPALSMLQARSLLAGDFAPFPAAGAQARAASALGLTLAVGLGARALARHLPGPLRPFVAAATTATLVALGPRLSR